MSALPLSLPPLTLNAARREIDALPAAVRNNAMLLRAVDRFDRARRISGREAPADVLAKAAALGVIAKERGAALLRIYQRLRDEAVNAASRGKFDPNKVPPYAGSEAVLYRIFGETTTADDPELRGLGLAPALLTPAAWTLTAGAIVALITTAAILSIGAAMAMVRKAGEGAATHALSVNAAAEQNLALIREGRDPLPLPAPPPSSGDPVASIGALGKGALMLGAAWLALRLIQSRRAA